MKQIKEIINVVDDMIHRSNIKRMDHRIKELQKEKINLHINFMKDIQFALFNHYDNPDAITDPETIKDIHDVLDAYDNSILKLEENLQKYRDLVGNFKNDGE